MIPLHKKVLDGRALPATLLLVALQQGRARTFLPLPSFTERVYTYNKVFSDTIAPVEYSVATVKLGRERLSDTRIVKLYNYKFDLATIP